MNYRKLESGRFRILAVLAFSMLILIAMSCLMSRMAHADDVNNGTIKLTQGETKQLTAAIADAPQISWTSSNPAVCATVNTSGLIQAVGQGTCTISAAVQGKRIFWTVKVNPLKLNKTSVVLLPRRQGVDLNLNYKKADRGASWSSSHPSVASVNGKGSVVGLSPGTSEITATWNNVRVTCSVQVLETNPSTLRQLRSPKSNRRKVVIAGSTLLDYWAGAQAAFGSVSIVNNAVPRSTLAEWKGWRKKLITDYRPKAVIIGLGIEDIDMMPEPNVDQLAADVQALINTIHRTSRKAKIFFVSVPLYPGREAKWDAIRSYNAQMKAFCASNKSFATFMNLNAVLLKGGVPDRTLFHGVYRYLSDAGYNKIKRVIVTKKVKRAAR